MYISKKQILCYTVQIPTINTWVHVLVDILISRDFWYTHHVYVRTKLLVHISQHVYISKKLLADTPQPVYVTKKLSVYTSYETCKQKSQPTYISKKVLVHTSQPVNVSKKILIHTSSVCVGKQENFGTFVTNPCM